MCDIIQTNQINIYPQLFCCNHNVCEHDAEIKFVVFAKQSAMSDGLFGKDMDTVFINDKTPWQTVPVWPLPEILLQIFSEVL